MKTLLGSLSSNESLAGLLNDFDERSKAVVGPLVTPIIGTHVEAVVVNLSRLWLRQTVDDQYSREQLFQQIMSAVRDRLSERSITKLGSQGIQFDAQPNAMIVGFHLVAGIWH